MGPADGGCVPRQRSKDLFIPRLRAHTDVSDAFTRCVGDLNQVFRVPFGVKRLNAACGVMITGPSGVDLHS